ncbi:MAG: hypothetical protein JOZ44_05075 [Acidobacteria bacterium]|nr:hypothetical protein [Acidobacteriota bacterium]
MAVASLTIALLFLCARWATAKLLNGQKSTHNRINRYVTVIRRDVLFAFGSAALMMSVIYLTCLLLDQ